MQPEEVEMNNVSKSSKVLSGICSATLLGAFAATAFGHDDDHNRTDKPLVWVDSKGKTIGRAVGDRGVQARVRGHTLVLPVGSTVGCDDKCISLEVTWGGESQTLYFDGEKCGGAAYISGFQLVPGSARPVVILGNTLYIGPATPLVPVELKSQKSRLNGCIAFPFALLASKVETTLSVSSLPFKPPFYLK
jgi:hypothetical protein